MSPLILYQERKILFPGHVKLGVSNTCPPTTESVSARVLDFRETIPSKNKSLPRQN